MNSILRAHAAQLHVKSILNVAHASLRNQVVIVFISSGYRQIVRGQIFPYLGRVGRTRREAREILSMRQEMMIRRGCWLINLANGFIERGFIMLVEPYLYCNHFGSILWPPILRLLDAPAGRLREPSYCQQSQYRNLFDTEASPLSGKSH